MQRESTAYWSRTGVRRESSAHTAHRIWERLRAEVAGCDVCERRVRQYAQKPKHGPGLAMRETYVPQSYDWRGEAQVDWYEAWAELGGKQVKLQVFAMRNMASGGAFHRAYSRASQQAFLEAHEHALSISAACLAG